MSNNQFSSHDFSLAPDYSTRQMFLDPKGRVTIQRYDEYAYPRLNKFDETQRGYFWVPDEITLTKDKIDFKNANDAVKHIFTSNLLRQTALDSIQGRVKTLAAVNAANAWRPVVEFHLSQMVLTEGSP